VKALFTAAAIALCLTACGGSSGGATTPSPSLTCSTLPNATTILIANGAVCPQALAVARGSQVTFINNDTRAHEMNSDPHPEHSDCPDLNQVGHLEPGQSRATGNLNVPRSCGYHDHINPSTRAMQGIITVQ